MRRALKMALKIARSHAALREDVGKAGQHQLCTTVTP